MYPELGCTCFWREGTRQNWKGVYQTCTEKGGVLAVLDSPEARNAMTSFKESRQLVNKCF